ncbi:putative reverse transcriptase domain-containing protein [Tanacetum coccineum]
MEAARTMLIFSKASLFLWAKAVTTAFYTQNLSLIQKCHNKTPYELLHNRKPDLSCLYVFGALCYPTNDGEDLGKLKLKADIGIFVGYDPVKKDSYQTFLLLLRMFHQQRTIRKFCFNLCSMSTLNLPPSVELQVTGIYCFPEPFCLTVATSSTIIVKMAPSIVLIPNTLLNIHLPVIPLGVKEADYDIEFAHMDNNSFVEFPILEPSSEESSTQVVIPNHVHSINQLPEYINKWSKDHPLNNVIGDPFRQVSTRQQDEALLCYFDAFLSSVEPKSYKDALTESCWIEAMQEELIEFECLEVWELVPLSDHVMIITLKWIYKVKLDELGGVLKNKAHLVARGYRLEYPKDSCIGLTAFVYADHAGCQDTRKSSIHSERVKISSTNVRLETTVPQKEETFQVVIDLIKNSKCFKAFTISADVPEIFMQQFWTILDICPRVKGVNFTDVPDDHTVLTFLIELAYKGPLNTLQPIFRCDPFWGCYSLSGKTTSNDKLRKSRIDILWGMFYKENVNYPELIWEDLAFQIDHWKEKRSRRENMPFPRFTKPVDPPSPDYVPGPEYPSSPDYVPGPEHPPSPIEIPYVPEPEYPEYLVPSEDEAPMEDQPLPADASPVALSPGYVPDSDPEEDPEEDSEEEHADYPADGGDGDDEPSGDDTDDDDADDDDEEPFEDEEDDEEEEEHLAPADSPVIPVVDPVPSAGDTEAFETDESAPTPRPPQIRIPFAQTRLRRARKTVRPEPPMSASMEARIAEHAAAPTPPLPVAPSPLPLPSPLTTSPTDAGAPLGYRAAGIRMRAAVASPPSLLPPTVPQTDVPEAEIRCNRAFPYYSRSRYSRESSSACAERQPGPTPAIDTWDEIVEAMMEIDRPPWRGSTREDRPYHRHTALALDREDVYARIAWTSSEERSAAIEAHVRTLEAQLQALINQGVAAALAERDASRSRDDDNSHSSGTDGRRQVPTQRECTYTDFLKCQPINFKGT